MNVRTHKYENIACSHTVDDKGSTLVIPSKITMVHPQTTSGYCPICKGFFTFIKDDKGEWILENK